MSKPNQKSIRFAALVRVSSERQESEGESLRTQRKQIERDVHLLGGRIVEWYGGAESATPGHEKREVSRLVTDASKGRFDAVIVTDADRWSRDNVKSREGLNLFKAHGVRFFVSTSEYDLFKPEHVLFLSMSAAFGEFQATHQSRKSILNRIERAKRGWPTCGVLPFGRTFDKATGKFIIDPDKLAMVMDVAKRYIAGEAPGKLAQEHGQTRANLYRILTQRCGTVWLQRFRSKALNIDETVETKVPELLPEETIRAIRDRLNANRTYSHGQLKNRYLLSRMVFCSHCGCAMSGQCNSDGRLYYRHAPHRKCSGPKRAWVAAQDIELDIITQLFDTWGNPAGVRQAIEAAIPNQDEVAELRQRQQRLKESIEKISGARKRILALVVKDSITEEEAQSQLFELKDQEANQAQELERINSSLEHVMSPKAIQDISEHIAKVRRANRQPRDMTWEQARALVEMVFGGMNPDGSRMGVYVQWSEGKEKLPREDWKFTLRGRFVSGAGPIPDFAEAAREAGIPDTELAEAFKTGERPMRKFLRAHPKTETEEQFQDRTEREHAEAFPTNQKSGSTKSTRCAPGHRRCPRRMELSR